MSEPTDEELQKVAEELALEDTGDRRNWRGWMDYARRTSPIVKRHVHNQVAAELRQQARQATGYPPGVAQYVRAALVNAADALGDTVA